MKEVEPNDAHKLLVNLEEKYEINIVTQNVDDLHERAGSKNILHIHGELTKIKSSGNDIEIDIGYNDVKIGDLCVEGFQMRPAVVWFDEPVPKMKEAGSLAMKADILIVIGTSLIVYPAAGLVGLTKRTTPIYIIDPNDTALVGRKEYTTIIKKPATQGVKELVEILMKDLS